MAFSLTNIHEYYTDRESGERRLRHANFVLRLYGQGAHYPIFIQHGECYTEAGDVVEEPPAWFWAEVGKQSPDALRAVEFTRKPPVKLSLSTRELLKGSVYQYCEPCNQQVQRKHWNRHLESDRHLLHSGIDPTKGHGTTTDEEEDVSDGDHHTDD